MIDDLWHATVNGRGQMFESTDAFETAARIVESFEDMTQMRAGQSALSLDTPDLLGGNGLIYAARYDGKNWAGDIEAYGVTKATGVIAATPTWSAATILGTRSAARLMATSHGGAGIAFTAANLTSLFTGNPDQQLSSADVDYLRGNRSGEGTTYRTRRSLLGAVINAQPLVLDGVIYASTGEGSRSAGSGSSRPRKASPPPASPWVCRWW